MSFDFTKTSAELFLDLVNTKSTRPLTAAELVIGQPAAGTTGGKNTTVHLSAVADAPLLEGEADFHYDRLDLATVFTGKVLTVEMTEAITSTLDIAAILNAKYKLNIGSADIEDDPIMFQSKPPFTELIALGYGLLYTGQVQVALTYPAAKDDLATLLGDGIADGFVAPTLEEQP